MFCYIHNMELPFTIIQYYDISLYLLCPFHLCSGMIIYFGYGIRHSAEAALSRHTTPDEELRDYKPTSAINGDARVSPEKEAFLGNGLSARADDEGELLESS